MKKFYNFAIIFTTVIIILCGFNVVSLQNTKAEIGSTENIENVEYYSSCCSSVNNELLLINTPLCQNNNEVFTVAKFERA